MKVAVRTPQKKAGTCLAEIEKLRKQREERRKATAQARKVRAAEEKRLADMGMPGDVDFQRMIDDWRDQHSALAQEHTPPGDLKICICVRKRPVNPKEVKKHDFDSVTCLNPRVTVHDCKLKVDGITKFLDNTEFAFDHTYV
jgi:kinesin family protein 2/24